MPCAAEHINSVRKKIKKAPVKRCAIKFLTPGKGGSFAVSITVYLMFLYIGP